VAKLRFPTFLKITHPEKYSVLQQQQQNNLPLSDVSDVIRIMNLQRPLNRFQLLALVILEIVR